MPNFRPDLDGATVALVGQFNPAILQPLWLSAQQIVREEAAEDADIEIIHNELARFQIDQMTVQVTKDKFQASTTDAAHWPLLRDLAWGIFSVLEHTPVTAMGLNRQMPIAMPSASRYNELGHLLAPTEPWQTVLGEQIGLASLTIQGKRPGSNFTWLYVKVEPSKRIENGVFISTNEHYETPNSEALPNLLDILKDSWESAQDFALTTAEHIVSYRLTEQ